MKFTWDPRKARNNERKHRVSFPLAQEAFETGLGILLDEQFEDDEWRTLLIAPFRGIFLLAIVFTVRHEGELADADGRYEKEEDWHTAEVVIRIISARKASREEARFYFANRLSFRG